MECVRELRMLQPAEDEHVDLELVFKKKAVFEKIAEIFPTHTGQLATGVFAVVTFGPRTSRTGSERSELRFLGGCVFSVL